MMTLKTFNLKSRRKVGTPTESSRLKTDSSGIAIYIAITITGALVLVSFAIVSLALKQINISSAGRDSQAAFYAADSGVECALFWDAKNPNGQTAFSTSSPQTTVSCNADTSNPANATLSITRSSSWPYATSTLGRMNFSPRAYCADIQVIKNYTGGSVQTTIESRGYNTCLANATRRVERAVRVDY